MQLIGCQNAERLTKLARSRYCTRMDAYAILGVSPSASHQEIKQAYRNRIKQHHPDHNNGSRQSAQQFAAVHAAYEQVLAAQTTFTTGCRTPPATATFTTTVEGPYEWTHSMLVAVESYCRQQQLHGNITLYKKGFLRSRIHAQLDIDIQGPQQLIHAVQQWHQREMGRFNKALYYW